jgi:hypothetical protein
MAKVPVALRIDNDLHEVLTEEARRQKRSMTAQIEFLLRRSLKAKLAARAQQETETAAEESE